MSKYYVVSAVMPWSSITLTETGLPLRSDDTTVAGYMAVYTTRMAAQAVIDKAGSDTPVGRSEILEFDDGREEASR